MEPSLLLRRVHLEQGSNSRPLDQWASAKPTELKGLLNQSDITQKQRKWEQSFLCVTSLDLIRIPIKLHEGIPNGY